MNKDSKVNCNWCGQLTTIVWVHGHGQCEKCRTNIDECCRGEVTKSKNTDTEEN
jgi:hypothetical protein